jgi:hypothetical protein
MYNDTKRAVVPFPNDQNIEDHRSEAQAGVSNLWYLIRDGF